MTENELKLFVKNIIQDQIKGTVGNDEEKEAWKEMKDFFLDEFEEVILDVRKSMKGETGIKQTKSESDKRTELLQKREKNKKDTNKDMW